ncbi:hypothetical protein BGW42_002994 [Actinomortierella wolfii]|nr:hypothetical protein BGW42_002994 [Actinomortierella wolfii]
MVRNVSLGQSLTMADLLYPRKPTPSPQSLLSSISSKGHGDAGPTPVVSKAASTERVRSTFFTNLILLGIESYGSCSSAQDGTDQSPHSTRQSSSSIQPVQCPQSISHVIIDLTSGPAAAAGNTSGRHLGVSMARHRPLMISKDMFARSNQSTKALEFVLWFLFDRLDRQQCRERFKDCWPIMDRHDAREFRNVVFKWLDELRKEGRFAVGHGGQQKKQRSAGAGTTVTSATSISATTAPTTALSSSIAPGILTVRPSNENTELGGSTVASTGLWSRLCINGMDVMATIRRSYLDESTGERIEQIILVLSTYVLWVTFQREYEKQPNASLAASAWPKNVMAQVSANPTSKSELDRMSKQLKQEVEQLSARYAEERDEQSKICQQWASRAAEISSALEQLDSDMSEMHSQRRLLLQQLLPESASREQSPDKDQVDYLFRRLEAIWQPAIKSVQGSISRDQDERSVAALFGLLASGSSNAKESVEEIKSFKKALDRKRREIKSREECRLKEQELSKRPFRRLLDSLPSTEIASAGSFRPLEMKTNDVGTLNYLLSLGSDSHEEEPTPVRQHRILESIQGLVDQRAQSCKPSGLSKLNDHGEIVEKSAYALPTSRLLSAAGHVKQVRRLVPSVWTEPRESMARRDLQGEISATNKSGSLFGNIFSRSTTPAKRLKPLASSVRPVASDLVVTRRQESDDHSAEAPASSSWLKRIGDQQPLSALNKEIQRSGLQESQSASLARSYAPRWSLSRKRQQSSESPVYSLVSQEGHDTGEHKAQEQVQDQQPTNSSYPEEDSEQVFSDQDVFGTPKKRRRMYFDLPVRSEGASLVSRRSPIPSSQALERDISTTLPSSEDLKHMELAMAKSPLRNRAFTVPNSQPLTLDDLRAPTPKTRKTKGGQIVDRPMPLMLIHTPQQRKLFGIPSPAHNDRRSSPLSPVRPLLFSPKSPAPPAPTSPLQPQNPKQSTLLAKNVKQSVFGSSIFARFQPTMENQTQPSTIGKQDMGQLAYYQSEQQQHRDNSQQQPPAPPHSRMETPFLTKQDREVERSKVANTISSSIHNRLSASHKLDAYKSSVQGNLSSEPPSTLKSMVTDHRFKPALATNSSLEISRSYVGNVHSSKHSKEQTPPRDSVNSNVGPWSSASSSSSLSLSSVASSSVMRQQQHQPPTNPWGRPPSWKPSSPKMVDMDKKRQAEKAKRRAAREAAVAALSLDLKSSRMGAPSAGEVIRRRRPSSMFTSSIAIDSSEGYRDIIVPLNDVDDERSQVETVEDEDGKVGGDGQIDDDQQDMDESSPSPVSPIRLSFPMRALGESTIQKDTSNSSLPFSRSTLLPSSSVSTSNPPTSMHANTALFQRARKMSLSRSFAKPNIQEAEEPISLPTDGTQHSVFTSHGSHEFAELEKQTGKQPSTEATLAREEEDEPTIYNLALQSIFDPDNSRKPLGGAEGSSRQSSSIAFSSSPRVTKGQGSSAAAVEHTGGPMTTDGPEDLGSSLGMFDRLFSGDSSWTFGRNNGDDSQYDNTLTHGLFHETMPGSLDPDEAL